jgi:hypothetical protein
MRPLVRYKHGWEDSIKMGIIEIGYEGMYWIQLAQGRIWWRALANVVMGL